MKLAIGQGVALQEPLLRDGTAVLDHPAKLSKHLTWWKKQGVEGLVFYDTYPGIYERSVEHFKTLKAVLDDLGLPVGAFNALRKSLFIPGLADRDEKRLNHCLDVAAALGATILDVSANVPLPTQHDAHSLATRPIFRGEVAPQAFYEETAVRLKSIARRAAGSGIELSIELHDDGLQDTADDCLKLMKLIDEPNVGLNPDVGNWARVPYEHLDSWRDQVAKMAAKTNYLEVKNYQTLYVAGDRRSYSWGTFLDNGMIDFREAATILWRAGFRGWVCHEGGVGDYVRSNLHFIEYFRWIRDEWIPACGD